ncbi:MAG: AAA family ATPase [Phocaeicola sp.]
MPKWIIYTLNQLANEGHVFAEEEQLVKAALNLLGRGREPIPGGFDQHDSDGRGKDGRGSNLSASLSTLPKWVQPTGCWRSWRAREGAVYGPTNGCRHSLRKQELNMMRYSYRLSKKLSVRKVMVLTEDPVQVLLQRKESVRHKHMGMRILLAAPTGRAAKRMSEATGMKPKTIHRLLEFNPKDGYKRNDENPLEREMH